MTETGRDPIAERTHRVEPRRHPGLRTSRAPTGGYAVETVERCVTETQTGFQRCRSENRIDQAELRDRLAGVHAVGDRERAEFAIRTGEIVLDRGEAALWAHALGRDDDRVLCAPDKAAHAGTIVAVRDSRMRLPFA